MYRGKDPALSTPMFSELMKCDWLEQVRKMIYFFDLTVESFNFLLKLEPFLERWRQSFVRNCIPSEDLAVEEYLCRSEAVTEGILWKLMFLKTLQYLLENTCVGASF